MRAKYTENMTRALEGEKRKTNNKKTHPKWKCVLLVVWGEFSIKKRKNKQQSTHPGLFQCWKPETSDLDT